MHATARLPNGAAVLALPLHQLGRPLVSSRPPPLPSPAPRRSQCKVDAFFGAGGPGGTATYIRVITVTRPTGGVVAQVLVKQVGASWVLEATANGQKVLPNQPKTVGGDVTVRVSAWAGQARASGTRAALH